jgi:hypothetical protein
VSSLLVSLRRSHGDGGNEQGRGLRRHLGRLRGGLRVALG